MTFQAKKDIEQVEKRLEASIDQLKEGQREQRKGNRWAIGLLAVEIIGGLTLLGIIITYQNSDMWADIREIRSLILSQQTSQTATDQAKQ